jgi:hypothetical protein
MTAADGSERRGGGEREEGGLRTARMCKVGAAKRRRTGTLPEPSLGSVQKKELLMSKSESKGRAL